ncbi:hypothetical protein JL722_11076 [Aureococcus anophagefferens]|nr:hypothetical protein JL722_11076 [Aureococcus anophagefferens]
MLRAGRAIAAARRGRDDPLRLERDERARPRLVPAVVTRPAADADDAALNFEIYSGPAAAGPRSQSSAGAINGAVDVALLPAEYGTKWVILEDRRPPRGDGFLPAPAPRAETPPAARLSDGALRDALARCGGHEPSFTLNLGFVARGDNGGVAVDTRRWARLLGLLLAYFDAHCPDRGARVTSVYVNFADPGAARAAARARARRARRAAVARRAGARPRARRSARAAQAEPDRRTREDHVDRSNVGPSYLVAFGSFAGGRLRVPGRGPEPFDVSPAANRERAGSPFFRFDAARETHGVEPFDGLRIAVSFYARRCDGLSPPRRCARGPRLPAPLAPSATAPRTTTTASASHPITHHHRTMMGLHRALAALLVLAVGAAASDFSEVAEIVASDGAAGDNFGVSVASSGDFVIAKLVSSDTAALDQFGVSVAIHNDIIVVGANHDDDAGYDSGSAYIFKTSDGGATWPQVAKLVAPDAEAGDRFGWSVAVEGNLVVVGAMEDDTNAGSAYAFLTSDGGATWDQGEKFVADDRAAEGRFGSDVKISGDVVVVGAYWDGGSDFSTGRKGAAYVFRATDGRTGWTQEAMLVASDRAVWDHFGYAVSINEAGDVIAVGSYGDDDIGSSSGSAYVFRTTDGGAAWTQAAKLAPSSLQAESYFGNSLSISGNTLAVGAFGSDTFTGRAYLFSTTDNGASWTQDANLQGSGKAVNDRFGKDLVLSGNRLVVGARAPSTGPGSVYIFEAPQPAPSPTDSAPTSFPVAIAADVPGPTPSPVVAAPPTDGVVAMSSSTAGIDTQTVSESLDLGVAAHRVALASSPTAPCDIYSASASSTMDANSRVCLMLNTTDEDSESYVAFLKTATVRNLDSGLEYALVSNRKFGQSAPGYKYAGAWLNDAHADLAELTKAYHDYFTFFSPGLRPDEGATANLEVQMIVEYHHVDTGASSPRAASSKPPRTKTRPSSSSELRTHVTSGNFYFRLASNGLVVNTVVLAGDVVAYEAAPISVVDLEVESAIAFENLDASAPCADAGADYAATYLSEFVAGVAAAADDGLFVQVLQQGGQVFADVAVDAEATPAVLEEEKGQESLAVGAMKLGSKKASPLNDLDDVVLPVFAEYADDEEVERAAAQPLDEDEASIFWEDLRREASSRKKVYGSAEANRVERELLERFGRFKGVATHPWAVAAATLEAAR